MADYIISDPHGDFNRFINILNKINFMSPVDHLYVLGDVVDRGPEGLRLFSLVRQMVLEGSADLIKGNHELFMQAYLEGNLDGDTWERWGGKDTRKDVDMLRPSDKEDLIGFLSSLPFYLTAESKKYGHVVMTHSGLDAGNIVINKDRSINVTASILSAAKKDEFSYLVSDDLHRLPKEIIDALDTFLIVGHVPVMRLGGASPCRVLKKDGYLCIDTGAGYRPQGGRMSVTDLDTGKTLYL